MQTDLELDMTLEDYGNLQFTNVNLNSAVFSEYFSQLVQINLADKLFSSFKEDHISRKMTQNINPSHQIESIGRDIKDTLDDLKRLLTCRQSIKSNKIIYIYQFQKGRNFKVQLWDI